MYTNPQDANQKKPQLGSLTASERWIVEGQRNLKVPETPGRENFAVELQQCGAGGLRGCGGVCVCVLLSADIPEDEARYWAKKLEQINAMRDQDVSCPCTLFHGFALFFFFCFAFSQSLYF